MKPALMTPFVNSFGVTYTVSQSHSMNVHRNKMGTWQINAVHIYFW